MNVEELLKIFDNKFPFNNAESWDNCGLLVGSKSNEVVKVFTTLDIDIITCKLAVENGCNVIVSHHPIFAFDPLSRIDLDEYNGQLIKYVLEHDLNLIALHTNVDFTDSIMSVWIANYLGFDDISPFVVDNYRSIGVVANVNEVSLFKLLKKLTTIIGDIKYSGDDEMEVSQVVIVGGSGSSFIKDFNESSATLYLTGDLKYHDFHDATKINKAIADIGHYQENIFVENVMNGIDCKWCSNTNNNVVKIVNK